MVKEFFLVKVFDVVVHIKNFLCVEVFGSWVFAFAFEAPIIESECFA